MRYAQQDYVLLSLCLFLCGCHWRFSFLLLDCSHSLWIEHIHNLKKLFMLNSLNINSINVLHFLISFLELNILNFWCISTPLSTFPMDLMLSKSCMCLTKYSFHWIACVFIFFFVLHSSSIKVESIKPNLKVIWRVRREGFSC